MQKNAKTSMVKTVFELEASLKNYNEKMEEIGLGCMHACVRQPCQVVSGGTSSAWRGFYAVANYFSFIQLLIFIHRRDKNLSAQLDLEFYASDHLGLQGSPPARACQLGGPRWLG